MGWEYNEIFDGGVKDCFCCSPLLESQVMLVTFEQLE